KPQRNLTLLRLHRAALACHILRCLAVAACSNLCCGKGHCNPQTRRPVPRAVVRVEVPTSTRDTIVGLCNGPVLYINDVWSNQTWLSNDGTTESFTVGGSG